MRLIARAALALLAALPLACTAADDTPKEGVQYKRVLQPQDPIDPKKVEVTEVFWYGCPHCYHFDPTIEGWRAKAPGDVIFDRLPSTLGRADGEVHARAFFIAEALGVGDKVHKPLFNAIHQDHKMMNTLDQLRELFGQVAGVKPQDFDNASSSFMVDSRMRRSETLLRAYGISSVPTIVVDGRYMTGAGMAGSEEKVLDVLDFLVEKVRKERKLK
ncbi:MAG TPA: thiol:disulfide interchange protein DsbA/DsbL [Nevskiaceae bacterium]|nr:thiol:disulfide interchange protein DsbA/DsbL [Nevskiaceae bacterium]